MFLHQTLATWRFSSSLTKFDLRLTPSSSENSNFDPTIGTGWDQGHCKDYWMSFPMTILGLKLELKRLRYLENHAKRICLLLKAITFDLTVGIAISLVFWKLHIQKFQKTPRSTQSKSSKVLKRPPKSAATKWPPELKSHLFAIKTPRPPLS